MRRAYIKSPRLQPILMRLEKLQCHFFLTGISMRCSSDGVNLSRPGEAIQLSTAPPPRCFNTSPAMRRDSLAPNLSSPSIPALHVGTAADWTDVGRALPTATGQRKHQEWRICGSLVFKSTFIDQRTATFTFLSTLMLSDTSSIRNETASTPSLIYH